MNHPKLRVVFDINVMVDALAGKDSTYPLIAEVPPATSNSAADAFSLAYDAVNFSLYVSPHILKNSRLVLEMMGLSTSTIDEMLEVLIELVHLSGGSVVEPNRTVFDIRDFEDNLILDLVKGIDAQVLVTSDWDLLQHNPWNGRLILTPFAFVEHVVRMKARY
jgi:putative PIN family toxin of toxin-antitoxin system